MSKETIKMNQLRITRIGIKEVLNMAEQTSISHRHTIQENWDKEDDKECRKALYKAHRGLQKSRAIVRECQAQLRATKREMRLLNKQHDFRLKAISENQYQRTSLLG
jgi:hypothetical protein